MFTVPIDQNGLANYVQRTALDGVDYVLSFQWSRRDSHWYISIADQDEVPIASGVRVVADWPILRRCVDARRPPGILFALDTSGAGQDPGFGDFGTRVLLIYAQPSEL